MGELCASAAEPREYMVAFGDGSFSTFRNIRINTTRRVLWVVVQEGYHQFCMFNDPSLEQKHAHSDQHRLSLYHRESDKQRPFPSKYLTISHNRIMLVDDRVPTRRNHCR